MKKAKLILAGILVIGVAGGVFAAKAKGGSNTFFQYTANGVTTGCELAVQVPYTTDIVAGETTVTIAYSVAPLATSNPADCVATVYTQE
jgi:hypothetical protein